MTWRIFIINYFILTNLVALVYCQNHDSCESLDNFNGEANLSYDEAVLFIKDNTKAVGDHKSLEAISTNCYNCSYLPCINTFPEGNGTAKLSTMFPFKYRIMDASKNEICSGEFHFGEHGEYQLQIQSATDCSKIKVVKDPIFTYLPLIVMFCIIFGLCLGILLLNCAIRKYNSKKMGNYESIVEDDSHESDRKSLESSSKYGSVPPHEQLSTSLSISLNNRNRVPARLGSLDTFRGISIIIMIFVNYGGGKYWFFNHSKWNGLTVADLVFPWFIFIMGSSIFISCRSMRRKSIPRKTITYKIFVRTVKLFCLGLFLNNGKYYENWRIPGVLQRFAFSYFVVAFLNVWLSPEEEKVDIHYNYDWRDGFRDLTWFPLQHLVMLCLLVVYLCLTFLLPVPECPTGYIGAGGLSIESEYANCTGGAAAYIDREFFGLSHIYNHPTCTYPYQCSPHDPEGLLGIIPSILLTYFGLMAARILFMYSRPKSHIRRWLIWAVILGAVAIGLSGAKKDGGLIPINKNLWSISFIAATASMAFLLLTICYVVIDVKRFWNGAPFHFAGMNSIMLYCGHEILSGYFPFDFKNNGQHSELLTQAGVGTLVWLIIAYSCFKTNVFWKI